MKRNFKGKEIYGIWTLLTSVNSGGNGEVWVCQNELGEKRAIKLLKKIKESSFQRFCDEVKVIQENQDISNVVPIYDSYLPTDYQGDVPWYIMPLGTSFFDYLKEGTILEKVGVLIKIAKCLIELHNRGIAHRDIKPSNLIIIDNEPFIIDFGLVDFPDKTDLTGVRERIGPRWTIAPEISRARHDEIDFLKADVYSFTKTIWILLTGIETGFEGQYNSENAFQLSNQYPEEYLTPIDEILADATRNVPTQRPDMRAILSKLESWVKITEDFHLRNNAQWSEYLSGFFPINIPDRAIWSKEDDIISILNSIGSVKWLNHMFFPDGGGMDLESARKSFEHGCIELDFELIYIVKPKRLVFESFHGEHSWNYFRLETGVLDKSGVYSDESLSGKICEEVSELSPGIYDKFEIVEYKSDHRDMGYEIPEGARHVCRYFEGSFVIFNKRSYYNLESSTYDGRHNKMSTDQFRNYIKRNIKTV